MSVAALWGTTVSYAEFPDSVMIETLDGRVGRFRTDTFDYLYTRLTEFTAAMKNDCIEYMIYQPNISFEDCPQWFIQAIEEGYIYAEEGYDDYIFYHECGDIVMSPGSVILRNLYGQLNYMEKSEFDKYYDTWRDNE